MGSPHQGITRVTYPCSTLPNTKKNKMAMSRTALLVALLAGIVISDGGAQSGYGAPQAAYESYDYSNYAPAQEDGGLDIGAKLEELLPLFIALFAPFQLQLCNIDGTAFPRSFSSETVRSFLPEGISEDKINILTKFAEDALESISSKYGA